MKYPNIKSLLAISIAVVLFTACGGSSKAEEIKVFTGEPMANGSGESIDDFLNIPKEVEAPSEESSKEPSEEPSEEPPEEPSEIQEESTIEEPVDSGEKDTNQTSDSEEATEDSDVSEKNGEVNTDKEASSEEISYDISDTSFQYYKNSIGSTEFYGYVEILNTGNSNIYMDDCVFDLEDDNGHLLQSEKMISNCPSVIGPGEKGYFYNNIGSTLIDNSVSLDNGIKLVPQMKLSAASGKPHAFPVSDVSVTPGNMNDVKVTGRVENDTNEEISYIYIHIIFYDSSGKALAMKGTSLSKIAPGSKGSFDTSTLFGNSNLKIEDIADTKVIAEDSYHQF